MKKHMNITGSKVHEDQVYPGQILKVPVVLYRQRNGSVPGIVRGELVNKSRGAHFAPLQETQQTEYSCTNITYTILSTGHHELILLRVDGIQFYEQKTRALVNVTLLPCPPGFQLSNLSAQCECNSLLKDRGLVCNISGATPLVQRTKSVWISIHPNRNDTILHDNCPLDYCKPTSFWLQLKHPDEQCAYKHSGLLCGRCKSNLSLAIGTSQCLECTNIHLTLLLPFAMAGLMLVLFLILCQHCSCKSCFLLRDTKDICSESIPKCACSVHSLAEFGSWNRNLFFPWHGCLHTNLVAVCLPILHMDDSWSHHLLEQALHHHCQAGGFQCSFSACHSVSSIVYETATYCHYCLFIHIPA